LAAGARAESEQVAPQVLGARLDHFELLDSIGVGGMGRVFRARDIRLDRLVALKVLSPELSNDPEICRRFEQEAKAAARLDDRHFARVYYFGFDKNLRYIAMEYVEGENIRQKIIKNGRLSVPLVIDIGIQIARGLAHATACGVVHRDIKPSNIILTPDGTAKLVDMGLARNFFQQSSPASELTQAGVTLGTFDYISPEQALDPRDADVRSDIYSLGCTLYHALTGRPPFSKGSALQKILQHQNDPVPDPRRYAPELPEPVVSILVKMLVKEPKDRYQRPEELVDDFHAVAQVLDVPLPDEVGRAVPFRPRQTFWRDQLSWFIPVAVLLGAIGLYAALDRPSQPVAPFDPSLRSPRVDQAVPTNARSDADPSEADPFDSETSASLEAEPILVRAGDDLGVAIRRAPPGSILKLAGSRYVVGSAADTQAGSIRIDKDLRIEPSSPADLVEILIRHRDRAGFADDQAHPSGAIEILAANFECRRIAFSVDAPDALGSWALFQLQGGRLRLRQSLVRMNGGSTERTLTCVQLDTAQTRQTSSLLAEQSLFLNADEVVRTRARGPASVELVDCGIDDSFNPPFRLDGPGDVAWRMVHTTVRTTAKSLFRIQRLGSARISAIDNVFSHSLRGSSQAPAVVDFITDGIWADAEERWWTGQGNLFHGYVPITIARGGSLIASNNEQARELGFDDAPEDTLAGSSTIWEEVSFARTGIDPSLADRFRLRSEFQGRKEQSIGMRTSPWGNLYQEETGPDPRTNSASATSAPNAVVIDPTSPADPAAGIFNNLEQALNSLTADGVITLRGSEPIAVAAVDLRSRKILLRAELSAVPYLFIDRTARFAKTQPPFRIDSRSQLTLEGIGVVAQSDGRTADALVEIEPGGELIVRDTALSIDADRSESTLVLARSVAERSPFPAGGSAQAKATFLRSSVKTAGSVFDASIASAWSVRATDSLFVARGALVSALPSASLVKEESPHIQLERTTVIAVGPILLMNSTSADPAAASPHVDARESLILGAGTSPMLLTLADPMTDVAPLASWSGADSFIAGFELAWGNSLSEEAGDGRNLVRSLRPDAWKNAANANDAVCRFGSAQPFPLSAENWASFSPPTLSSLRQWEYPADFAKLVGVSIQILPPSPVRPEKQ
jgi:serine/threonine protein kinase